MVSPGGTASSVASESGSEALSLFPFDFNWFSLSFIKKKFTIYNFDFDFSFLQPMLLTVRMFKLSFSLFS